MLVVFWSLGRRRRRNRSPSQFLCALRTERKTTAPRNKQNTKNKKQCSAFSGAAPVKTWSIRVSLPVYCMAMQSVIGWVLFLLFGGWGLLAGPVDWVHEYVRRPRCVIPRSQYLERARGVAQRAREIRATSDMLKRQDRASGGAKGRGWRSGLRRLQREVVALEADEALLDHSFPQGADGEARWVLLQLRYLLALLGGLLGLCLSLMWIAHIVVYMLPPVPVHPLLNEMFVKMDAAFPLFGVAFFSLFTFYLLGEGPFFFSLFVLVGLLSWGKVLCVSAVCAALRCRWPFCA